MITRYTCGHLGKMTTGKNKAFIFVAEIRNQKVEDSAKQCPVCSRQEK